MDFVWFVLTAQKELEALLWICFTPIHVFSVFYRKNIFRTFFIENFSIGFLKSFMSCPFNWKSLLGENPKYMRENNPIEKFSIKKNQKNIFSVKNRKYMYWSKTYPKESF